MLALLAAPAAAADLGGQYPPEDKEMTGVLYEPLWQGSYVGMSFGGGWGLSVHEYNPADNQNNHPTVSSNKSSGYLGALTLGYNFRPSGSNLMFGVEADVGYMDIDAPDRIMTEWDDHVWKTQFGGLWGTLRARAGYVWNRVLLYGTAGIAFMNSNEIVLGDNDATQNTYNQTVLSGWVYGGGIEYAISRKVTAKLEYLRMDFARNEGYTNDAANDTYWFDNKVDLVRAGINFRF